MHHSGSYEKKTDKQIKIHAVKEFGNFNRDLNKPEGFISLVY